MENDQWPSVIMYMYIYIYIYIYIYGLLFMKLIFHKVVIKFCTFIFTKLTRLLLEDIEVMGNLLISFSQL